MFFKYLWSIVQPKTADQAGAIKYRLALAYAFFGWSACSYFFYRVCSDRLPSDPDERTKALINKWANGKTYTQINIQGVTSIRSKVITPDVVDKEEVKTT